MLRKVEGVLCPAAAPRCAGAGVLDVVSVTKQQLWPHTAAFCQPAQKEGSVALLFSCVMALFL